MEVLVGQLIRVRQGTDDSVVKRRLHVRVSWTGKSPQNGLGKAQVLLTDVGRAVGIFATAQGDVTHQGSESIVVRFIGTVK